MQVVYTGSLNGVFKGSLIFMQVSLWRTTSYQEPQERVKKRLVKIGEINIKYRF